MKKKVIIYARVATEVQQGIDSFQSQVQEMIKHCDKHEYEIIGSYQDVAGGMDLNRVQLQEFLNDLISHRIRPDILLCAWPDRLSRNPCDLKSIEDEIKKFGVKLEFTSNILTASGEFHQNFIELFFKLDAEQRKAKIIMGIIDRLKKGGWCGTPPVGYQWKKSNRGYRIVKARDAKFIRSAFKLKASKRLSNDEICELLLKKGFKISSLRLNKILTNPFYCGLLTHRLLGSSIVKGQHPAIISKELFNKVTGNKGDV